MPEPRLWIFSVIVLLCLWPLQPAAAADAGDELVATRGIAQAGALRLALRRIDALQPADKAAPQWPVWERLRLQLLAGVGRNAELLQRTAAWPDQLAVDVGAELHAAAAQAALALGRGAVAREHAGRALWSPGISAEQVRDLRLLVIRSYVGDTRGANAEAAYHSMLRYQQDYRPLDAAMATGFVRDLLDIGRAQDAVTWLGLLDERGAVKLRLRLHTGLIPPQEAVTQARAGLIRSEETQWWRILLEAAERMQSGALRVEALERLFNTADASGNAVMLWDTYFNYARGAANTHHLLAGDDLNWLEFAMRQREVEPVIARAYFAWLAHHARAESERQRAQTQLAESYAAAKLTHTGLRVFAASPGDPVVLTAATRRVLGTFAETVADHERALLYWQELPAPDGMSAEVWQLRLAALALRAGSAGVAADYGRQLAASTSTITTGQLPEWITLAQQFADHGLFDGAAALYERVLPQADTAQARIVLAGIARLHDLRSQPLQAADYYLRAALRASGPDAAATAARLQAGLSLARAGLREDARAQFEWLLKNASDPLLIAIARRELGF